MNAALIWFIASILLFAAEIITPGFVLACFGGVYPGLAGVGDCLAGSCLCVG